MRGMGESREEEKGMTKREVAGRGRQKRGHKERKRKGRERE